MWKDFLSIIFPDCCYACNDVLTKGENVLCTYCLFHLPKTNFHLEPNNSFKSRLLGKIPIKEAFAYYKFTKGGQVQKLVHAFKYKGIKEIGEVLGTRYGLELYNAGIANNYDLVVPVPLHKSKLKKRGYNQAAVLAKALAKEMKIEYNENALEKTTSNQSQTTKSKFIRWKNVNEIYVATNVVANKRVLLVDDVVTTGATFESCGLALSQQNVKSISATALAIAQ